MKVIVLRNREKPETEEFLKKMKTLMPEVSFREVDDTRLRGSEARKILEESALFLVLGGDGTTLKAAGIISEEIDQIHKAPALLSVDFGRRGFLSTCSPEKAPDLIQKFFKGERFLLRKKLGEVRDLEENTRRYFLNEVSVLRHYDGSLIDFVISIGEEEFKNRGDGFLLATPTGASAYAHSAGGPEIVGIDNALIIVFLAPERHVSPIVVGEKEMPVRAEIFSQKAAYSVDGRVVKSCGPFHLEVSISKEEVTFLADIKFLTDKKKQR